MLGLRTPRREPTSEVSGSAAWEPADRRMVARWNPAPQKDEGPRTRLVLGPCGDCGGWI